MASAIEEVNSGTGKCSNCGKPGHRKDDCCSKGGRKENEKPEWLKQKERWEKEREEGSGDNEKEKLKPKPSP